MTNFLYYFSVETLIHLTMISSCCYGISLTNKSTRVPLMPALNLKQPVWSLLEPIFKMEIILEALGDPGRYHVLITCMFAVTWWSMTFGAISMAFYGEPLKIKCNVPSRHISYSPNELPYLENSSVPFTNISMAKDECSYNITSVTNGTVTHSSHQCDSWTYLDGGREISNIVTEVSLHTASIS